MSYTHGVKHPSTAHTSYSRALLRAPAAPHARAGMDVGTPRLMPVSLWAPTSSFTVCRLSCARAQPLRLPLCAVAQHNSVGKNNETGIESERDNMQHAQSATENLQVLLMHAKQSPQLQLTSRTSMTALTRMDASCAICRQPSRVGGSTYTNQ